MATAYKVLGQVAPAATTATTVYTVPSATEAVVSSVTVCNRAGAAGKPALFGLRHCGVSKRHDYFDGWSDVGCCRRVGSVCVVR
jgi:hypothetical protein